MSIGTGEALSNVVPKNSRIDVVGSEGADCDINNIVVPEYLIRSY